MIAEQRIRLKSPQFVSIGRHGRSVGLNCLYACEFPHIRHIDVLIRYTAPSDHLAMATLRQKMQAEVRMRELLEDQGLPPPDAVEYGYTCVRLFWHETKTVVIVDIDEPPPGWKYASEEADPRRPC